MLTSLAVAFPVFALILIGWVAARLEVLPEAATDMLNMFVVRLALPVLLFQFVAEADWRALWHPDFVIAVTGGIAITFVAGVMVIGRGQPLAVRSIEALAASYANTAFMGIPIGQALFGTTGIAAAVIASLITACALFAFAILLAELGVHRAAGARAAAIGVTLSIARNPLVIGPALGAAWALLGVSLPDPLHRLASLLGAAASPVALVTIGLFLAHAPRSSGARPSLPIVVVKLVVQPVATFALATALGMRGEWRALAVLVTALPTGTGPFMLAKLYGIDAATTARAILVTTILSAITVPLVLAALAG